MTRKLKVLGLALVAVFAMSAVVASSAMAATEFESPESNATANTTITIKKHQNIHTFTVNFGAVTCETSNFDGTRTGTKFPSIRVTAEYKECLFAGIPAVVEMNGCEYILYATGEVDIVCAAGKEITVTATSAGVVKCIVHVPPQTALKNVTYTNVGAGATREITAHLEIASIKYSQTEGTGLGKCTTSDNQVNGTYTGTATATGETTPGNVHTGILIN